MSNIYHLMMMVMNEPEKVGNEPLNVTTGFGGLKIPIEPLNLFISP